MALGKACRYNVLLWPGRSAEPMDPQTHSDFIRECFSGSNIKTSKLAHAFRPSAAVDASLHGYATFLRHKTICITLGQKGRSICESPMIGLRGSGIATFIAGPTPIFMLVQFQLFPQCKSRNEMQVLL